MSHVDLDCEKLEMSSQLIQNNTVPHSACLTCQMEHIVLKDGNRLRIVCEHCHSNDLCSGDDAFSILS